MITANPIRDAEVYLAARDRVAAARDRFVDTRIGQIRGDLLSGRQQPQRTYWAVRPVAAIQVDFAAWVNETHADPEAVIGLWMTSAAPARELVEQYAQARAEAEADDKPIGYFDEVDA